VSWQNSCFKNICTCLITNKWFLSRCQKKLIILNKILKEMGCMFILSLTPNPWSWLNGMWCDFRIWIQQQYSILHEMLGTMIFMNFFVSIIRFTLSMLVLWLMKVWTFVASLNIYFTMQWCTFPLMAYHYCIRSVILMA
jgi:hypothetical protein